MLYHWESVKIVATYEQIQGKWWLRVDCTKWGVDPDMLEGRCITAKGVRKRLGRLAQGARPELSYYRPWEIQDYCPPQHIAQALRDLWMVMDTGQRDKQISSLRRSLKDCAARARAARPTDAAAPTIEGWQRWALEPLDWTLLDQARAADWPLPPNAFKLIGDIDISEFLHAFKWQPERGRQWKRTV